MLKARVGGEGVLTEGIRREREGSTVGLTEMSAAYLLDDVSIRVDNVLLEVGQEKDADAGE